MQPPEEKVERKNPNNYIYRPIYLHSYIGNNPSLSSKVVGVKSNTPHHRVHFCIALNHQSGKRKPTMLTAGQHTQHKDNKSRTGGDYKKILSN